MSVIGTNPFRPRETDRDAGSAQESTNSRQQVSENGESTSPDVKEGNKIKLPALAKTKRLNHEEKNDLKALLRIRCYDFSLQVQGLKPEVKNSSKNSSLSSGSQSAEESASDQSQEETKKDCKKTDKDKSSLSFSTVLEGQRVNLKEKMGLNNIEKEHVHSKPSDKENKGFSLNDLRSENYRLENMLRSTIVSLKHRAQDARPVFHLPKVDKYDITPEPFNGKICSVFKLNDAKALSTYSGLKDSWVPMRDRYFMSNSEFFKSLYMQPTVLPRQPSPVAGVKINLRGHEEGSLVAAIHVAKETVDVVSPSVDTEATKKVDKIVIRLPPIC